MLRSLVGSEMCIRDRWIHSCYRMQQGRRPCSRNSDGSSILFLMLAILDLMSRPRTPSPILVVVVFLIVKVLFSFLRDEWMRELIVGSSYLLLRQGG